MSGPGFCIWLTGLSGSGKSTIAAALDIELRRLGRSPEIFDGDAVRALVSTDLGFSRADRDINVGRVAALAREVVDASGIAICALMSPYAGSRKAAQALIGAPRFILVYVATPLAVCELRDPKGLYQRARRGEIRHVVGIDDDYEPPADADLRLDTSASAVHEDVQKIVRLLTDRNLVAPHDGR